MKGKKNIKCRVLPQDIDGILGHILHSKFKELPHVLTFLVTVCLP